MAEKICPCCGNVRGCDCYLKQSEQNRRIAALAAKLAEASAIGQGYRPMSFDDLQYTLDGEPISARGLIHAASELDDGYGADGLKTTSAAARVLRDHGHSVGTQEAQRAGHGSGPLPGGQTAEWVAEARAQAAREKSDG
jgi:hypothetical protein